MGLLVLSELVMGGQWWGQYRWRKRAFVSLCPESFRYGVPNSSSTSCNNIFEPRPTVVIYTKRPFPSLLIYPHVFPSANQSHCLLRHRILPGCRTLLHPNPPQHYFECSISTISTINEPTAPGSKSKSRFKPMATATLPLLQSGSSLIHDPEDEENLPSPLLKRVERAGAVGLSSTALRNRAMEVTFYALWQPQILLQALPEDRRRPHWLPLKYLPLYLKGVVEQ
jgi:hypothetical protein